MSTAKYKIYLPGGMKSSLENDAELFEFYKPNGEVNLNGFLKSLLVNYFDMYSEKRTRQHKAVVDEIGAATSVKNQEAEELASKILEIYKDAGSDSIVKSSTVTLTVSGRAYDVLGMIEQSLYGTYSLSQYVRNLLSSYLSAPRSMRERIIFSAQYDEINRAIKGGRTLSLSTSTFPERIYSVCPYSVTASKEEQYNYLLCYDIEKDAVRSFRLSRIRKLFAQTQSFQLDDRIIDKLKMAEDKGPQFAFESLERSCVQLTEEGKRKFRMIYTNRPEVVEKRGNMYFFEWPLMQLEEYFKRFGKDAELIEPAAGYDYLEKFYEDAYQKYKSE